MSELTVNMNDERRKEIMARLEKTRKKDGPSTDGNPWEEFSVSFFAAAEDTKMKLTELEEKGPDQSGLTNNLDEMTSEISKLQRYLTESISYLPAFESGKCNKAMQDINEKFQEIQKKLKPQKKFGFKNRTKAAAKPSDCQPSPAPAESKAPTSKTQDNNAHEIKGRHKMTILVSEEDSNGKDILLSDLQECRIRICGAPGTLHMAKLNNCVLFADPVATSVFLDNCTKSELAVACQQLRMHSSKDLTMNIHVTSRGIIEDCSDIRFASYAVQNVDEECFKAAGLDPNTNHWSEIQDFNWLSTDEQSPNWLALDKSDWTAFTV